MGKSVRLRLGEIREVFRLVGDCRDLGADRAGWVNRALEGLRKSLSGYLVFGGFLSPKDDAAIIGRGMWDAGWLSARDRGTWMRLMGVGRFEHYLTVQRGWMSAAGGHVVQSRCQIIDDVEWDRCLEFQEDRRAIGADDTVFGLNPLAGGVAQMLSINRAIGEPRFSPREAARLRLFQAEIGRLVGSHLAVDDVGPIGGLTPRLRQVLQAFVEGDSEKQVAARLGISRHTVHSYVKEIHERLGVMNRAGLIAAWHRHERR